MSAAPSAPTDLKLRIVTYPRLEDTAATAYEVTWEALVERLGRHEERAVKDGRLWSPVTLEGGATTRLNENIASVNAMVIDQEHSTPDWDALAGYKHVAHTTFSHRPDDPGWRVVIPFTKPVPAGQWADVWERFRCAVAPGMDSQCKDPSRAYFLPSVEPGREREVRVNDGDLLDWEKLPPLPEGATGRTNGRHADSTADAPPRRERPLSAGAQQQVITTLAPHWTRESEKRHRLTLCLAGWLYKREVDRASVEVIFRGLARLKGDGELEDRLKAIATTWERAARGEPIEGWAGLRDWLPANPHRQLLAIVDRDLGELTATTEDWGPSEPAPGDPFEDAAERLQGTGYGVHDGRLAYLKVEHTRAGSIVKPVPLCNFLAAATEQLIRDDGSGEVTRALTVVGRLAGGAALGAIQVPGERFTAMNWPVEQWGLRANVSAGVGAKDRLREAIQHLSAGASSVAIYTHTGFRTLQGRLAYLHGGGALGLDDVRVDLPPELARYRFPDVVGDVPGALAASLRLLDVGTRRQMFPLWAAAYLAPLNEWLGLDFLLWLRGITGSLKSTLLALFLCHFGAFDRKHLPGNFVSTANALERRMFLAKDVLFGLDDFAPQSDPRAGAQMAQTAEAIIRRVGDLQGRGRLRSDTTARPTYAPRCLVVATGEQAPPGTQSSRARCFVVPYRRDDTHLAKLSAAQADAGRLPHAMAGYLAWLMANAERLRRELPEARATLQERLRGDQHLRLPEIVADLLLGLSTGLTFAVEMGALDRGRHDELVMEGLGVFTDLAAMQEREAEQRKPTRIFLTVLGALLVQGAVHVRNRSGERLSDPSRWGWRVDGSEAHGELLGWVDDAYLYLIPGPAYNRVARFLRDRGEVFPVTEHTLRDHLDREGMLVVDDGHFTAPVKVEGQLRRVLRLDRGAIEPWLAGVVTARVTAGIPPGGNGDGARDQEET